MDSLISRHAAELEGHAEKNSGALGRHWKKIAGLAREGFEVETRLTRHVEDELKAQLQKARGMYEETKAEGLGSE